MKPKNQRANLRGVGSFEKRLTRQSKRFFVPEYTQFSTVLQCEKCRSDYMRFSLEGICQRCLQRHEHESKAKRPTTAGSGEVEPR
jgi:hypothetical protein